MTSGAQSESFRWIDAFLTASFGIRPPLSKTQRIAAPLGIALLCALVFGQVGWFDFVQYDDPVYVSENRSLADGLASPGLLRYVFTTNESNLWHPLTWLSHALDVSLFGQGSAGGHHLVSLALHAANTWLSYLLALGIARRWDSPRPWLVGLATALLFAIHPLHVESAVWLSERKGLLSTLFLLGSANCYLHRSGRGLLPAFPLFLLALLAKPSAVVLPGLLVALDALVLRRAGFGRSAPGLGELPGLVWVQVREKGPYLLCGAISSLIAIRMQAGGSHAHFALPLAERILLLPARLGFYLQRTLWPVDLNFSYPPPAGLGFELLGLVGLAVLAGGAIASVRGWRSRPQVGFAWLWALVCFLPVSGLATVGTSFTADRYTYLLLLGPFVALATGVSSLWSRRPLRVALVLVVALLSVLAFRQAGVWKNSHSLFAHSMEAQPREAIGFANMGTLHDRAGRSEEARTHYEQVLALRPNDYIVHHNLARIVDGLGDGEEAERHYRRALEIYPDYAPSLLNLSHILLARGRNRDTLLEAQALLERACGPRTRINRPLYLKALADVSLLLDDVETATSVLREALSIPTSNTRLRAALEETRDQIRRAGLWEE